MSSYNEKLELFFDMFNVSKEYIQESDHLEFSMKLLDVLDQQGINIRDFHGEDDILDEALSEILEDDFNEE